MFFEIMWVGVLVGAIPIMFYIQDVKIYQYLHNLEEVKMQVQNQRNLASETMLREKHDIRHHNRIMFEMVKEGKTKECMEYLNLKNDVIDNDVLSLCPNEYINHLLKSFYNQAKEKGVELKIKATVSNEIEINAVDLVCIYSNILENAINGCLDSGEEKPDINLSTSVVNDKLAILCSNTSRKDVVFNQKGIPKSQNKQGLGTSIILRISKKYGGVVSFSLEKDKFIVKAVLNAQSK